MLIVVVVLVLKSVLVTVLNVVVVLVLNVVVVSVLVLNVVVVFAPSDVTLDVKKTVVVLGIRTSFH